MVLLGVVIYFILANLGVRHLSTVVDGDDALEGAAVTVVVQVEGAVQLLGVGDQSHTRLLLVDLSLHREGVGLGLQDGFGLSQQVGRVGGADGEEIDEEYEAIDNEDRADIAPLIKKYMRPDDDDTFRRALEVVILDRKASTSYLQRRLKIGYNRAAEIVDQMEERGILGPPSGSGNKRDMLVFDGLDIGE